MSNQGENLDEKEKSAEIISILPFLKKAELQEEEDHVDKLETDTFETLLHLLDMPTDAIAGSLISYYAFNLNLFEGINAELALEELKNRAITHLQIYDEIKNNLLKKGKPDET